MIISASRRTDIPAFYGEWFLNRLRAGFCEVLNPFNPNVCSRVSMAREDVDVFVFWTRNPEPFSTVIEELESRGYAFMFLYTLTAYGRDLEPHVPPPDECVKEFQRLANRLGASRVVWRYDPIIVSDNLTSDYHLKTFGRLADRLAGHTERVIVSLADYYRKTERRLAVLERAGVDSFEREPESHPDFEELMSSLKSIADASGMCMQSCCEESRLVPFGIEDGKCIDDLLIKRVFGMEVDSRKDPGQRKNCGCVISKDIGATDSCLHGCEYCYSTRSHAAAVKRHTRHDPSAPCLIPRA